MFFYFLFQNFFKELRYLWMSSSLFYHDFYFLDTDILVYNFLASDCRSQPEYDCLALGGGGLQAHLKGNIFNPAQKKQQLFLVT